MNALESCQGNYKTHKTHLSMFSNVNQMATHNNKALVNQL